jgi:hypothetical protein
MPDYQNGQIYALRSYQTDLIYIGSSCQPLHKRLHGHKKNYKLWQDNKYSYVTSFEIIKFADCYIELLEDYPCNSKNELNRKEGGCIRSMACVNKKVEGRTPEEYYEYNKEQILEYHKEYYEDNKEQILEYHKEYYENNKEQIAEKANKKYDCKCGSVVSHGKKARHNKSQKHQSYLASITNI